MNVSNHTEKRGVLQGPYAVTQQGDLPSLAPFIITGPGIGIPFAFGEQEAALIRRFMDFAFREGQREQSYLLDAAKGFVDAFANLDPQAVQAEHGAVVAIALIDTRRAIAKAEGRAS